MVGRPLAEIQACFLQRTLDRATGNREEAAKLLSVGERNPDLPLGHRRDMRGDLWRHNAEGSWTKQGSD